MNRPVSDLTRVLGVQTTPFHCAATAWFWALPAYLAKRHGARVVAGLADVPRPCEPADVVVCDDVEVPNTAGTADKRRHLRERLGEVEFVLAPGGTQLFIGTPHAWASIYAREARREEGEEKPFLDGFDRLDIPAHDRHGRAAWPERYPADHLAHMRRRTGAHSFASQMLLQQTDPRGVRLDPARLKPYDGGLEYYTANGHQVLEIDGRRMARGVAWWDPAMGRPDRGDASVVAAVYADDAGGYWLHRIAYLTIDPERLDRESEIDQLCRQVGSFLDGLHLPKLLVEKNGLGAFLPGHLRNALAAVHIGTRVEEAHSRTAKAQRILDAFDAVLGAGALHVQRTVWDTPFIAEMRDWQAEGNPADDGLDAVAGCLLAGPVRLPVAAPPAMPDWRPGAGTFIANTNFAV